MGFWSEDVTLQDLGSIWEEGFTFGFELPGELQEHIQFLNPVVDCLQRVDYLICIIREVPNICKFQLGGTRHRTALGRQVNIGCVFVRASCYWISRSTFACFDTFEESSDWSIGIMEAMDLVIDSHINLIMWTISCWCFVTSCKSIWKVLLFMQLLCQLLIGCRV